MLFVLLYKNRLLKKLVYFKKFPSDKELKFLNKSKLKYDLILIIVESNKNNNLRLTEMCQKIIFFIYQIHEVQPSCQISIFVKPKISTLSETLKYYVDLLNDKKNDLNVCYFNPKSENAHA